MVHGGGDCSCHAWADHVTLLAKGALRGRFRSVPVLDGLQLVHEVAELVCVTTHMMMR